MQTIGLLYLLPTHTQTNQPIAHLRGQRPITASEPPAKWGADSRVDDNVYWRPQLILKITLVNYLKHITMRSVSQPPAEVCLTDLAWDYPGV